MKKWIFVIAFVSLSVSAHAQQDPIKLGILLNTGEQLSVMFFEKKPKNPSPLIWSMVVIAPVMIANTFRDGSRNADLSKRLQASVGDTIDRRAVYQRELTAAFAQHTTDLELVFLAPDLIVKGKPDFKRIDAQRTPYVVVLAEGAGLATQPPVWGTLAPVTTVDLRVYDVRKKKRTFKDILRGFGTLNDDEDAAVDSADTFVSGYPQAVRIVSNAAYWRLSGKDVLHQLAKGTGFEDDFPSVKTLLKANAKRFDFDRPKIKGWKSPKTRNSYVYIAEPKKDKQILGIVSDVDLLLKELGQDFDSLDLYVARRLGNLADEGFGVESITEVPLLQFKDAWRSYMVSSPQGGYSIFLHAKVENLVLTHRIIVLEENPLTMLTKYQADIQNYVNNSALQIK